MSQLSDKADKFVFLGPKLPKNRFWGRKLRKLMWTAKLLLEKSLTNCYYEKVKQKFFKTFEIK